MPRQEGALDRVAETIALAERHVREAEAHVAHQRRIIESLDKDGHQRAAIVARQVLVTLQRSLELARTHLELERAHADDSPAGTPPRPGT